MPRVPPSVRWMMAADEWRGRMDDASEEQRLAGEHSCRLAPSVDGPRPAADHVVPGGDRNAVQELPRAEPGAPRRDHPWLVSCRIGLAGTGVGPPGPYDGGSAARPACSAPAGAPRDGAPRACVPGSHREDGQAGLGTYRPPRFRRCSAASRGIEDGSRSSPYRAASATSAARSGGPSVSRMLPSSAK